MWHHLFPHDSVYIKKYDKILTVVSVVQSEGDRIVYGVATAGYRSEYFINACDFSQIVLVDDKWKTRDIATTIFVGSLVYFTDLSGGSCTAKVIAMWLGSSFREIGYYVSPRDGIHVGATLCTSRETLKPIPASCLASTIAKEKLVDKYMEATCAKA